MPNDQRTITVRGCGGEVRSPAFSWSAGGFPVIASGAAVLSTLARCRPPGRPTRSSCCRRRGTGAATRPGGYPPGRAPPRHTNWRRGGCCAARV